MRVRRMLAGIAAGGMLLLGAQGAAAATIVPVKTLGRKVVLIRTASSQWTASAQGEYVDDNYVTKPDPNALRGRAAVKEKAGSHVRRIRMQYLVLQQQQADGSWTEVVDEDEDVVRQQTTAYAIMYTPPVRTCWIDEFSNTPRKYRVLANYGVRQDNGTATNRSMESFPFLGPRLADDPECPRGVFNAHMTGFVEPPLGEPQDSWVTSNFVSIDDKPVGDVTVVVDFDDSFTVEVVEAGGLAPDETTDDPNDYALRGATWPSGNGDQVAAHFVVTPTRPGSAVSEMRTSTSQPKVLPAESKWEAEVVEAPTEK